MFKQIFVNLPVKDLKKTKEFFSKLGLEFDPKLTHENGASMIISKDIYAMLLSESYFRTFTKKEIVDAKKSTEVITALAVESKKRVDEMLKLALKAGAKEVKGKYDHGWRYGASFEDIDGHIWEILYMNKNGIPQKKAEFSI